MAKEFLFRGKRFDEIKDLSIDEFAQMIPARERRTLKRGLPEEHKKLLEKIKTSHKPVKTHCRDIIIIPELVGKTILIHSGKVFDRIDIRAEMLGHRLGEFSLTRKKVGHSAPGIGATRSSAALSVR